MLRWDRSDGFDEWLYYQLDVSWIMARNSSRAIAATTILLDWRMDLPREPWLPRA